MIRLLFVGDGLRDDVTVPRLVERILNATVAETVDNWPRLRGSGRGFGAKLLFVLRQARDAKLEGVVATVDADRDRDGHRLRALKEGRALDRQKFAPLPTALGRAVPHGEAWLLDDPAAVSRGLQLPADVRIPTIRETKNPKQVLEGLLLGYGSSVPQVAWAAIAQCFQPSRCVHADETGFESFAREVLHELGPLATNARS